MYKPESHRFNILHDIKLIAKRPASVYRIPGAYTLAAATLSCQYGTNGRRVRPHRSKATFVAATSPRLSTRTR